MNHHAQISLFFLWWSTFNFWSLLIVIFHCITQWLKTKYETTNVSQSFFCYCHNFKREEARLFLLSSNCDNIIKNVGWNLFFSQLLLMQWKEQNCAHINVLINHKLEDQKIRCSIWNNISFIFYHIFKNSSFLDRYVTWFWLQNWKLYNWFWFRASERRHNWIDWENLKPL